MNAPASRARKKVVVVGGGLGGLAAAALVARAGHEVTLLEANPWLGGKSRRVSLDGQRIDTGPAIVTFPGVWHELLRRYEALGDDLGEERVDPGLRLKRLPEVGRYHFRDETVPLPVPEGHPWRGAWERFVGLHGALGPDVTMLLTSDWHEARIRPALLRLLGLYGRRPTTRGYLDALPWLPEGLREVIAIHTLNAGVGPARTPAIYASMPAVMATEGVWVPEGGVHELPLALARLARAAGADLRTNEPATKIGPKGVLTAGAEYRADAVVGDLDPGLLDGLLGERKKRPPRLLSCSGVTLYAALREELPMDLATHGVVLPSQPERLHASLERREEPEEAMAFVDHYRPGEPYPNTGSVLALGLTAPANGREYGPGDPFVEREVGRVSEALGLPRPATEYFGEHVVLHPAYFARGGSPGGALYGRVRPVWMAGPLHRPRYSGARRPWLWRVGASVHPGGGIPAVLGGAMVSSGRLLRYLSK